MAHIIQLSLLPRRENDEAGEWEYFLVRNSKDRLDFLRGEKRLEENFHQATVRLLGLPPKTSRDEVQMGTLLSFLSYGDQPEQLEFHLMVDVTLAESKTPAGEWILESQLSTLDQRDDVEIVHNLAEMVGAGEHQIVHDPRYGEERKVSYIVHFLGKEKE